MDGTDRYHFPPDTTSRQIPLHARYHFMPDTTSRQIPLHARYHFMLDTTSCQIPLHARYHFMPDTTSRQIPLHARYHFTSDTTSRQIPLHARYHFTPDATSRHKVQCDFQYADFHETRAFSTTVSKQHRYTETILFSWTSPIVWCFKEARTFVAAYASIFRQSNT